ncbi:unnamed protein product [Effrenium voratum]|nr:unnamed protein product [Effrenium voratum]
MADVLRDVFHAFAGGSEMEGRAFVKCLKDSGLLDERLKTVQADIIFARNKPKGSRKIGYERFLQALKEVAEKRGLMPEEAVDQVCSAHGPDYEAHHVECEAGPERFFYDKTTYTGMHKCGSGMLREKRKENRVAESWASPEDFDLKSGPERFYYDRSTYTGTHKNNGPSAAGSGVGKAGYSDLSVLVRRDVVQDDNLQRRRRSKTSTSPMASGTLPVLLGGPRGLESPEKDAKEKAPEAPAPTPEPEKPKTVEAPAPVMHTFSGANYATYARGPPAYVPPAAGYPTYPPAYAPQTYSPHPAAAQGVYPVPLQRFVAPMQPMPQVMTANF